MFFGAITDGTHAFSNTGVLRQKPLNAGKITALLDLPVLKVMVPSVTDLLIVGTDVAGKPLFVFDGSVVIEGYVVLHRVGVVHGDPVVDQIGVGGYMADGGQDKVCDPHVVLVSRGRTDGNHSDSKIRILRQ